MYVHMCMYVYVVVTCHGVCPVLLLCNMYTAQHTHSFQTVHSSEELFQGNAALHATTSTTHHQRLSFPQAAHCQHKSGCPLFVL